MTGPALSLPPPAAFPLARRWVVAYSGGLDSRVLLELCAGLRAHHPAMPPLVALHVNHGVHADASIWARHCAEVCRELAVPLCTRAIDAPAQAAGRVSEEWLRAARYRAFEAFCGAGDLLLLAHHRDDQAETLLLRLVRGAGAAGLAGMPRERACGAARLYRPLLGIGREELRSWATGRGLRWIEDPSNESEDFDRNYIRRRVLPLLGARWPGAGPAIARAAHSLAEAASICAERAGEDLAACRGTDRFGQDFLGLVAWRSLSAARRAAVLRAWLAGCGVGSASAQSLHTLVAEVIGARADAQPLLHLGEVVIRRYRERLYALPGEPLPAVPQAQPLRPGDEFCVPGAGRIALVAAREGGVRAGKAYRIGFGAPGLRCRPAGRPAKALKQLAQEYGVPPWLRQRMPLLYVDGELAAVADLCICEGFVAAPGTAAVALRWRSEAEWPDGGATT